MKVRIGLANSFVETAILRRDRPSLEANRQAAVSLAGNLRRKGMAPEHGEPVGSGRLVRGAPVSVVDEFLSAFRNHDGSVKTQIPPVRSYIRERRIDELAEWDILFPGVTRAQASARPLMNSAMGFEMVCQRRAAGPRSDDRTLMVTSRQRVSSRGIERTGLTREEIRTAEEDYDSRHRSAGGRQANYPDWIYRNVRRRPLLVVHLLAIGNEEDDLSGDTPVVAWSISFPTTAREEEKVEYVVNTTWYREHYPDEDDEDAADDD